MVTSLSGAIVGAEYFLGSDPGPGNGVALSLEEVGELSALMTEDTYSLVGAAPGVYRLGIRLQDDANRWSNPIYRSFRVVGSGFALPAVPTFPGAQVVAAEYFIGEDPGEGQGTALTVAAVSNQSAQFVPETIDLSGLADGVHAVSVRVQDASGAWGQPVTHRFRVVGSAFTPSAVPAVAEAGPVAAEYFIGEDPGEGMGERLVLAEGGELSSHWEAVSIALQDLTPGTYAVGVRLQDADGNWGRAQLRRFRIQSSQFTAAAGPALPAAKLAAAEYFIGEDPGAGNAEAIPLDDVGNLSAVLAQRTLELVPLAPGTHAVGVRLKDSEGRWSATQYRRFTIRSSAFGVSVAPEMLSDTAFSAEYFVGSAPAVGNATALSIANGSSLSAMMESVSADISSLEPGVYSVGVRLKDEAGEWSSTQFKRFEVKSADLVSATVESLASPPVPVDIHTQWQIEFTTIPQNIAYTLQITGQSLSLWGRIGESSDALLQRLKTAIDKHPLYSGLLQTEYDAAAGALQLTALQPGRLMDNFITVESPFALEKTVQGFLSGATSGLVAAEFFVNDDPGEGKGLPIQINTLDSLISAPQSEHATVDLLARYEGQVSLLIDMGDDLVWQSASVLNPDGRGNYWNSVRPATTYLNLVDTKQQDTGIGMVLGPHGGDSYNGPAGDVTVNGPEDSDYDPVALGPFADDRAIFDYISGIAETALGRFSLTGLDPGKTYDITLYGAKKYIQDGGDGTTVYRAYKDAAYSELLAETELVVGSTGETHNRDTLAYLKDLTPDAEGRLYFEFGGKQAWTEGFLNAMSITYGGGRRIFGLRAGDHRVGVRYQNARGDWSAPIYRSFKSTLAEGEPDIAAPVITLLGEANMDWPYGVPFVDPGFTVVDDVDGDLSEYTKGPEPVNALLLGEHRLLYEAVDSAGNRGTAERVVTIRDNTPPTIMGFENVQKLAGMEGIDYYDGLRVQDVAYGDLTHALRIRAGLVAPNYPGTYSVVFEVRDPAGNISTFIRYYEILEAGTYPPYATWIAEAATEHTTDPAQLEESADPDGDGHSNADEWLSGTDPFLSTSFLSLQTVRIGEDVVLQWSGEEDIQYWIEESADMTNWIQLSTKGVIGTSPELQRLIDLSHAGQKARFYRLRSEPVSVMEEAQ
jgi:hypothetical protein